MDVRLRQIDQNTKEFVREFGHLTPEELNWKPAENAWSIAQVVEHLILICRSYYPTFEALQEGTYKPPFTAYLPFLPKLFGKMILKSVQPQEERKVRTMSVWVPSKSNIKGDILSEFRKCHEELKGHIVKLNSISNKKTIISSPANRLLCYTLDDTFDIIITHERRHFLQAQRVKEKIN